MKSFAKHIRSNIAYASALAGVVSLVSSLSASPLDPADPYSPTTGQYPALHQNYGVPAQFQGTESIGMRQDRARSGQPDVPATVTGSVNGAVVLSTPTPAANAEFTTGAAYQTAMIQDHRTDSPVWRAINTSVNSISAQRGASAVIAANTIAPSFENAPYESHSSLGVYQLRTNAGSSAIDANRSTQFAGDSQTQYTDALRDVQIRKATLDRDFAAAQVATQENWSQVRATLASDYNQYAAAVARAQRLASGQRS